MKTAALKVKWRGRVEERGGSESVRFLKTGQGVCRAIFARARETTKEEQLNKIGDRRCPAHSRRRPSPLISSILSFSLLILLFSLPPPYYRERARALTVAFEGGRNSSSLARKTAVSVHNKGYMTRTRFAAAHSPHTTEKPSLPPENMRHGDPDVTLH